MLIMDGPIYYAVESPFAEYFRRCHEVGMTKEEISKNLPYLRKYYKEMVIDKLSVDSVFKHKPTLEKLLDKIID